MTAVNRMLPKACGDRTRRMDKFTVRIALKSILFLFYVCLLSVYIHCTVKSVDNSWMSKLLWEAGLCFPWHTMKFGYYT